MTARRWVSRAAHAALLATSAVAVGLAGHAAVNVARWRRPTPADAEPLENLAVTVVVPARNEAARISSCLQALLTQQGVPQFRVVVVDDNSEDSTGHIVSEFAVDARLSLISGKQRPAGWLGKNWACHQGAQYALTDPTHQPAVLVFVDADVELAPDAISCAVNVARRSGLDAVCPYPHQVCGSVTERVMQPLLQWSFLTTLPLRLAERSSRPSLTAANGQFFVVTAARYRLAGGHERIRSQVLDDVALMRAVKAAGGRGGVVDGTTLAQCRMYSGAAELTAGYAKSLWSMAPNPAGSLGIAALLFAVYSGPAVAAVAGARVAWVAVAAGWTSRLITDRATGYRVWPDALTHPIAIAAFSALTVKSVIGHARGTLRWKGRPISDEPSAGGRSLDPGMTTGSSAAGLSAVADASTTATGANPWPR